jgi:glutamate dehydrogenase/leucine dehydrogenase
MLETRGDTLKGKVVAISGSGNVAQYACEKVTEMGGKVVTLSDSSGYIYDPAGIDKEKLAYVMELKNVKRGRIKEYAEKYGVEYFEGKRPWGVKCDVAMPNATENEINEEQAKTLIKNGCYCVSEGANMPSAPEAINAYLEAGILYGPGKAANAGGVAVSGLEMTQNSMRLSWTRKEVDDRLQMIMKNIHDTCVKYGTQEDGYINYVQGANIGGFIKVADSMLAQGVV